MYNNEAAAGRLLVRPWAMGSPSMPSTSASQVTKSPNTLESCSIQQKPVRVFVNLDDFRNVFQCFC
jgi:hypothetical protein